MGWWADRRASGQAAALLRIFPIESCPEGAQKVFSQYEIAQMARKRYQRFCKKNFKSMYKVTLKKCGGDQAAAFLQTSRAMVRQWKKVRGPKKAVKKTAKKAK